MLICIRSSRRSRPVAALVVLIFAAWAFAAALPHRHNACDGRGSGGAAAGSAGITLSAAPVVPAACALCDWTATPHLPLTVLPLALGLPLLPSVAARPASRRRVAGTFLRRTRSRAPPTPV
jgi:hypothetical protein